MMQAFLEPQARRLFERVKARMAGGFCKKTWMDALESLLRDYDAWLEGKPSFVGGPECCPFVSGERKNAVACMTQDTLLRCPANPDDGALAPGFVFFVDPDDGRWCVECPVCDEEHYFDELIFPQEESTCASKTERS